MTTEGDRIEAAAAAIVGAREAPPLPPDNAKLAELPRNDYGNAQRLIARHGPDMIHVDEAGWYIWDGARYEKEPAQRTPESQKRAHLTALAINEEADALLPRVEPLRQAWEAAQVTYAKVTGEFGPDSKQAEGAGLELARAEAALGRAAERIGAHRKFARASGNSGKISAMLKEAEPYRRVRPAQLDADPFKFNATNACVILNSRPREPGDDTPQASLRARPHHRDDLMTHLMGVAYKPGATCEKFDAFLAEVQPDEAVRRFLLAWFGYCLTGDVGEQVMVLFHGKGANGKSTLLSTVSHVFGDYAVTLPIQSFLHDDRRGGGDATPDLARLPGARLVMASEPERGSRLSEAVVKTVTGGEKVVARRLFEGQFEFDPTFKLILSANEKPRITGQDEGIWRRVILVPFDAWFPRERRDPHLVDKLRAEAPGILNRFVEGFVDWRAGGLVVPPAVSAATEQYRAESDPVGEFVRACIKRVEHASIQARLVYDVYCAWCHENAVDELRSNGFGRRLSDLGIEREKIGTIYYRGIELSEHGHEVQCRLLAARERKRGDGGPGLDGGPPGPEPPPPAPEDGPN